METFLFYLAVITLVAVLATAVEFLVGNPSFGWLRDQPTPPEDGLPIVSVIIPARNEARNLREALQSVLGQQYPRFEVVAVNDRSTDKTGQILDELARREERLRVVHLDTLPPGWLGKNHALHCEAAHATGEWLLFTDADVVMESTVLRRAIGYVRRRRLDHLAITPQMRMASHWLQMFGGGFTLFFGLYAKPWKARNPRSARHIGIGAFNLLSAPAYRAIGGHCPIALRPDDDMKLGKLVKQHGFRQELMLGTGLLWVEWYASIRELVRGLEKNTFAGMEYNLAMVVASTVGQLAVFLWPIAALGLTSGWTWWANAAVVVLWAVVYVDNAGHFGVPRWQVIGFPLMVVLFLYIIWNATLKTIRRGGIEWRGTYYPLAELKANRL